jgi:hypothetical protein
LANGFSKQFNKQTGVSMSITTETGIGYHFFTSSAAFAAKADGGELNPGSLCIVENAIYLALTGSTFRLLGGGLVGQAPESPKDAEKGVFHYDQITNILKIAIALSGGDAKWVNILESFSSIEYGTEGAIEFVRQNGSRLTFALPKTDTIDGADDHELTTVKAVVDYVSEKIGGVVGGIRYQGAVSTSGESAITTVLASVKAGDLFRVNERIVASPVLSGATAAQGDWIIFKRDSVSPHAATAFDILTGVENAAIDVPTEDDHVRPLSAHGAFLLDDKINEVDTAKISKMADSSGTNAGQIVVSKADGTVDRSGKSFLSGAVPASGGTNSIPDAAQTRAAIHEAVQAATVKWRVD